MKRIIVLISFAFTALVSSHLYSQSPYQQSIGVRIGSANGFSWQQFLGRSQTATEWIGAYRRGGARLIGMVTQFIPLTRHGDAYAHAGLGGHLGMNGFLVEEDYNVPAYGVDGSIGVTYVFPYAPLAISLDFKPMVEMHNGMRFSGNNAGFSLRLLID